MALRDKLPRNPRNDTETGGVRYQLGCFVFFRVPWRMRWPGPAAAQEDCGDQEVGGRTVHYCRAGRSEPIIVLEARTAWVAAVERPLLEARGR